MSVHPLLRFELKAYSSLYLHRQRDIEGSDKILVPESVLHNILQYYENQDMPSPYIFEVKNNVFGNITHCGVLEFTSPEDGDPESAFFPRWMMDNLMLSDGALVTLQLRQLPLVTFVKFQPLKHEFTQIDDPKAALELALSKFTALTLGDTIEISYHQKTFKLLVTAIAPNQRVPNAGCVVDTNVEVDFDPPLEEGPESKDPKRILLNEEQLGEISMNAFEYFQIKLADPEQSVKFVLEALEGQPDLYISTTLPNSNLVTATWTCSSFDESARTLVIEPNDPQFSKSWYYLSVFSFNQPARYKFTVTQQEARSSSYIERMEDGMAMGRVDSKQVEQDPSQFDKCLNCNKWIPKPAFTMHSITCVRKNWSCPICLQVLPKSHQNTHSHCPRCGLALHSANIDKHLHFAHRKVKCLCGMEFESEVLSVHQSEECIFRLVCCKFCDRRLPFKEMEDHETMCGGKSELCVICHKPVSKRKMTNHMAAFHRINPCVDSDGNRVTADVAHSAPVQDEDLQQAIRASQQYEEDQMLATAMRASVQESKTEDMDWDDHDDVIGEWEDDVEMQECPICMDVFPLSVIETHVLTHDLD